MAGTPDDLDATTETETLTTVSVGKYSGQTVTAVMVTVTVTPMVSRYGMGTPAVDMVVRVVDAAQALLVDPVQLVSAPAAPVPVNVSKTDALVSGAPGTLAFRLTVDANPLPGRHRIHGTR